MQVKCPVVLALLAVPFVAASCIAARSYQAPEKVDWRSVKPLNVESIGTPVGQVWSRLLDQYPVPGKNQHVQLIWYKMGARNHPASHVASLNLTTGTLKTHGALPGWEVWRVETAGPYVYLGTQPPGHLGQYDIAADVLKDLGRPFAKAESIYSLSGAADGTVALGAAGSSEVSLYDPRTGKFRQFGEVGRPGAGFLYYIYQDARFIYAAPRGNCPWDLVAIDKATGAKTTLITRPAEGYINISGPNVGVTNNFHNKSVPWEAFVLRDGKLLPAPARTARGHRAAAAYEVTLDKRAGAATGKINVLFRKSGSAGPAAAWKSLPLTVGIDAMQVTRLTAVGPSQIVGTTGPYGQMFQFDIPRNSTRILGYPPMNAYSIATIGGKVYVSGYPSTPFAVADLNRPFTSPDGVGDGEAIPWTDARANPRQLAMLGDILQGSHTGVGVFEGADGRIYVAGQRHRHYKGFGVAWYDPRTGKAGEVDDGGILQQFQISWVAPADSGRKLVFSTRVQADENKSAALPKEAKLFILDTATGRFTGSVAPLPGVQALGPIAEVGGSLIGTASDPALSEAGPTTVYKFDLASNRTTATRVYSGLICGVSANHDAPQKCHDYLAGPDGKVWTMYRVPLADAQDVLMRIRPADLGIELIGAVQGDGVRMLFKYGDLYLSGTKQLRRLRSVAR